MAVIEFVNGRRSRDGKIRTYKTLESMKRLMRYVTDTSKKTREYLIGGKDCSQSATEAYEDFVLTKSLYNALPKDKNDLSKRLCVQFVQSFKSGEVDELTAKQIADRMVLHEAFDGYSILYAVHIDRKHIHTHFIVNTVNNTDGHAWQLSGKDLKKLKAYSDRICKDMGLSVVPRKKEARYSEKTGKGEYWAAQRGVLWKKEIFDACKAARNAAHDVNEYIALLKEKNIVVIWSDGKKDITYINNAGKKINSDKLGHPKRGYMPFTKEKLTEYFANKAQKLSENEVCRHNQSNTNPVDRNMPGDSLINIARLLKLTSSGQGNPKASRTGKSTSKAAKKDAVEEKKKGEGLEWGD